jgi:hypothetical protein
LRAAAAKTAHRLDLGCKRNARPVKKQIMRDVASLIPAHHSHFVPICPVIQMDSGNFKTSAGLQGVWRCKRQKAA